MSALTTRILVLGVVKVGGPANGYQLRRELLSWDVERWAQLNPGSVYSMLTTLATAGLIAKHELPTSGDDRAATVFTITDEGDRELARLVTESLENVGDSGDLLPLRVAFNFATFLPREDFLRAARARHATLVAARPTFDEKIDELTVAATAPPHVALELGLEARIVDAQIAWLAQIIDSVQAGALYFVGEDAATAWQPPDDDPGWRMAAERRRYQERLDAMRG
ncbi:PadR family transcriptional regulator [Pseudolysinimonas kribbensis]|uniref:PadR family transcriptional regulator n=1 Tax=Pseudolysinimonas kribbensis TaxID=433641 RepID=A0ABQ6K6Q4_9MICO|nr:PadR family transcriptional regulator [Pseudolysinimonas kribbensis]GMA94461.1 PadR family transcriptional regulator [Pseudolysinimonas kribbensis]